MNSTFQEFSEFEVKDFAIKFPGEGKCIRFAEQSAPVKRRWMQRQSRKSTKGLSLRPEHAVPEQAN